MKKLISCLVCFLLAIQLITINAYSINNQNNEGLIPEESLSEEMLRVNVGDGLQQVGYSPKVEGISNDGPQSFAINQNYMYLLDTLNKKILVYDNFKWIKNIDISVCSYARDIIVAEGIIYILDDTNIILEMDLNGTILKIKNLPKGVDAYQIEKLSLNDNNSLILKRGNNTYIENGVEWDIFETMPVEVKGNKAKIKKDNTKDDFIEVNFLEETGGINIVGKDKYGNLYIEVIDDVPDSSLVLIESTLRKYNKLGELISIARIPLEDYYNYPLRFFNVTTDGEVYTMALKDDFVEINKIILGKTYNSKMNELKKKANNFNNNMALKEQSILEPLSDPGVPTRTDVQNRANDMINLNWTYNQANSINPNPNTITKPIQLSSVTSFPSSKVGIPYCWGGFDGIDRSSVTSWSNFTDAMSKGAFAGNVDCESLSYRSPGTAGVDCSGFVSASLGFTTKYNTTGLYNTGNFISTPLRMDYYVVPGWHVLFFYSWTDSGMTKINSKEATTDGNPQAAKNYTRTKNWLYTNGYSLKSPW